MDYKRFDYDNLDIPKHRKRMKKKTRFPKHIHDYYKVINYHEKYRFASLKKICAICGKSKFIKIEKLTKDDINRGEKDGIPIVGKD